MSDTTKSICCNAALKVHCPDRREGTQYFICAKCGNPSDAIGDGPCPAPSPDAAATARLAAEEICEDGCRNNIWQTQCRAAAAILQRHFAPVFAERDALKGEVEHVSEELNKFKLIESNLQESCQRFTAALAASNQQRDELERAFEWLLTNLKATLQAIAVSQGRRDHEIDRFVDENLAVREARATLTRIRANRTTV